MRTFLHAAAGALLGACAGAVALVGLYAWAPALVLEMTHDRATSFRGLYPGERAGNLTFAWTASRADIRLPGLDRRVPWEIRVRARGARQDPASLPTLTLLADGVPLETRPTTNEFEELAATTPVLVGRRGMTVSIAVSDTFVPGPRDTRALGAQVDWVRISPAASTVVAPTETVVTAALGAALFGAVFGLFSATALTAVAAACLLALGQAAVFRLGTGPYNPAWLDQLVIVALAINAATIAGILALRAVRRVPLRNTACFAILFSGAVLYLKLAVLFHPDKALVDATFQVHRLQDVMAGRFFFTSIAPGGYEFPYAIGLYVAALPFAQWTSDRVELLRLIVAVADAGGIALLYWALSRAWGDRVAAAAAVGVGQLTPIGLAVQNAANHTNAFGQALAVAGMAVVLSRSDRPVQWRWSAAAFVLMAWAMLSHTSTFATLAAISLIAGGTVLALGRVEDRRYGWWIVALGAAAIVVALALYYAHFMPTYQSQFSRISQEIAPGSEAGPADTAPLHQRGRTTIVGRLRAVPDAAREAYTTGFLLLAAAGLVVAYGRFGRNAAWLVIVGWLLACALSVALAVFTPVSFRHYYAAQPAIAILAGVGLAALWRTGGLWRLGGTALALWGIAASIQRWLGTVGVPV